jgi:hypothetical protein
MMKRILVLFFCVLLLAGICLADEGMWLFNAFPKAKVKAKYGFEPTQAWLDHVRLSSVRFNNGGSGSFVSADGLTFTNHHVGSGCLHDLSTGGKDYLKTGFYAKTREEEGKCPDLELNVLMGIEDVTAKVNAAVTPDMNAAQAGQAQRAAMAAIEKECATSTGLRCDVITLYAGGMYHLYKYKKYTDVRVVFAPEFAMAFFGGDPDNFEYPRYDLDVTFFRIYENGKPVHLDNYFHFSKTGVKEGDLVFVSGNPGSTGRLLTMAQMEFSRDVQYPWVLKAYKRRVAALKEFSRESAENERIAQEDIFGYENAIKAVTGYQSGLLDESLMAGKAAEEKKLQESVASDPKKKAEFGDPWAQLEKAMEVERQIYLPLTYVERRAGFRGDLARIARDLVRVTAEKKKPNGERLREYRDSALPSLEQRLFSTAPIYKSLEASILAEGLGEMRDELGADDPTVRQALAGKTPEERAKELVEGTKLEDVAVRKRLYEGGEAAVEASTDPFIVLMRAVDPEARKLRERYDDEIQAVERREGATLAKVRFATEGMNMPPDATFTLRLSYGEVKGFTEDGRGSVAAKGAKVPYFTTMGGAFEHAAAHGNKPPYQLPESWLKAKSKIKLSTPLNNISTPDIIGGNSGSPLVNRAGEVVGIIFDGNIQSLPWRFVYEDKIGRSVSVDSRGIIEALRNIYGATALADELTGAPAKTTAKPAAKQPSVKK